MDCLGTANRQGAASVRLLDHNPVPPPTRDAATNPWPQWPRVHKHGFAQQEGVEEEWHAEIRELLGDEDGRISVVRAERVRAVGIDEERRFEPIQDTGFEIRADLVLLAMGFDGVEPGPLVDDLGIELGPRGNIIVTDSWSTTRPGIYACGDATRGASLVVWAIAEGRSCAAAVHFALTGDDSLPAAVRPTDQPI